MIHIEVFDLRVTLKKLCKIIDTFCYVSLSELGEFSESGSESSEPTISRVSGGSLVLGTFSKVNRFGG